MMLVGCDRSVAGYRVDDDMVSSPSHAKTEDRTDVYGITSEPVSRARDHGEPRRSSAAAMRLSREVFDDEVDSVQSSTG